MHPLVPGAVGQRGEAGKGDKEKMPLKSSGAGEECSVAHVVGRGGAGENPGWGWGWGMSLLPWGSGCLRQLRPIVLRTWQVFLAVKVGQAETQGASELTNLKPTTSKLNYSGPA